MNYLDNVIHINSKAHEKWLRDRQKENERLSEKELVDRIGRVRHSVERCIEVMKELKEGEKK